MSSILYWLEKNWVLRVNSVPMKTLTQSCVVPQKTTKRPVVMLNGHFQFQSIKKLDSAGKKLP